MSNGPWTRELIRKEFKTLKSSSNCHVLGICLPWGSRVLSLKDGANRKREGRFSRAVKIRSPTLTREIFVEGELAANSTSDNIDIDHGHQSQ
jgi:hypothetical protein